MRHFLVGAVAALFLVPPAIGQDDFVPPDFNAMERDCRQDDPGNPMHPICHVLVYEQWRLFTNHNAERSHCDFGAFWLVADEVLTPELRAGPFTEAIDRIIIKEGGVCRVL